MEAFLASLFSLEILSTIFTVACVVLANFRSTWQYPVGIVGTVLFFFAVFNQHLYANAGLQVFFTAVQLYGWWYWLRGGVNGTKPLITSFGRVRAAVWTGAVGIAAVLGGKLLQFFVPTAAMPGIDMLVFGFSVFAQFLLDRKKIENWIIWGVVNVASVFLYYQAGLYVFAALYVGLFINTFIAYRMWQNAQARDTVQTGAAGQLDQTVGATG